MIFFYFNLLKSLYFNQKIIIYFYLIIILFNWIRNFEEMSSRNEREFCRNEISRRSESFVEMKFQEEVKVLRNELEMSVAPMSR